MPFREATLSSALLHPDPQQPRKFFDIAQEEELTASIREHDLLQPIVVRLDAARQQYLIVCGERRWRAAQRAELKLVPVRILEGTVSPTVLLELALTENLVRTDLRPIELARSLQQLQGLLGCTQDELAHRVQKSPATISRLLGLLELPEDVQTAIEQGRLSPRMAAELGRCVSSANGSCRTLTARPTSHNSSAGQNSRFVNGAVSVAAGLRNAPAAAVHRWNG